MSLIVKRTDFSGCEENPGAIKSRKIETDDTAARQPPVADERLSEATEVFKDCAHGSSVEMPRDFGMSYSKCVQCQKCSHISSARAKPTQEFQEEEKTPAQELSEEVKQEQQYPSLLQQLNRAKQKVINSKNKIMKRRRQSQVYALQLQMCTKV